MGTAYRSGRATALLIVGIGVLVALGLLGGLVTPLVLLLVTGEPAVLLHMRDGTVVPVDGLKMSRGESGYTADRGYKKVSSALVQAHQQWYSRSG